MSSEPLKPFWAQPSHPDIQEVIFSTSGFLTKSISKIDLPPFALFAPFTSPPMTSATHPTYATVQTGPNTHINLNSDLVYINHSCDPSLFFDFSSKSAESHGIYVGPKGLKRGEELTFFYPSTEWSMAQGFDCFCGAGNAQNGDEASNQDRDGGRLKCRGWIGGAETMGVKGCEGQWLNWWIREGLARQDQAQGSKSIKINGINGHKTDHHIGTNGTNGHTDDQHDTVNGTDHRSSVSAATADNQAVSGRAGVTSREMSGEMGGDTL